MFYYIDIVGIGILVTIFIIVVFPAIVLQRIEKESNSKSFLRFLISKQFWLLILALPIMAGTLHMGIDLFIGLIEKLFGMKRPLFIFDSYRWQDISSYYVILSLVIVLSVSSLFYHKLKDEKLSQSQKDLIEKELANKQAKDIQDWKNKLQANRSNPLI